MKNVTITLDEATAAWARVYAAEHDVSVSRLIGEMLRRRMLEQGEYDTAMRRFLDRKPAALKRRRGKYPTRDALHERSDLR